MSLPPRRAGRAWLLVDGVEVADAGVRVGTPAPGRVFLPMLQS